MEKPQKLTKRIVRSFVLRNGRITSGQIKALTTLRSKYEIQFQYTLIDWEKYYQRSAPLWLEIGFGNGIQTAKTAGCYPEINLLGVEVHLPGIGHLLNLAERQELNNIRIIQHDAVEVLQYCVADGTLDRLMLFFPDPWPKKKHHKRRIVQYDFVNLVVQKLKLGGYFHLATDWEDYAHFILEQIGMSDSLKNLATDGNYIDPPDYRLCTKFEKRGIKKGHGVWDLLFQRL